MDIDIEAIIKFFFSGLLGIVALGMLLFFVSGMFNRFDIGFPLLLIAIFVLIFYIYIKFRG